MIVRIHGGAYDRRCVGCGGDLHPEPDRPEWTCRECLIEFTFSTTTDGDVDAAIARGCADALGPYR